MSTVFKTLIKMHCNFIYNLYTLDKRLEMEGIGILSASSMRSLCDLEADPLLLFLVFGTVLPGRRRQIQIGAYRHVITPIPLINL